MGGRWSGSCHLASIASIPALAASSASATARTSPSIGRAGREEESSVPRHQARRRRDT